MRDVEAPGSQICGEGELGAAEPWRGGIGPGAVATAAAMLAAEAEAASAALLTQNPMMDGLVCRQD